MDERQVINNLKMATSKEIAEILNKSINATLRQLKSLNLMGEIESIEFLVQRRAPGRSRVIYIENETYNFICAVAQPSR